MRTLFTVAIFFAIATAATPSETSGECLGKNEECPPQPCTQDEHCLIGQFCRANPEHLVELEYMRAGTVPETYRTVPLLTCQTLPLTVVCEQFPMLCEGDGYGGSRQ